MALDGTPLFCCLLLINIAIGATGVALIAVYGAQIPPNLSPEETAALPPNKEGQWDALREKQIHSSAFHSTMVGTGLVISSLMCSCMGVFIQSCREPSRVEPLQSPV